MWSAKTFRRPLSPPTGGKVARPKGETVSSFAADADEQRKKGLNVSSETVSLVKQRPTFTADAAAQPE
jgi:hypothetical protein